MKRHAPLSIGLMAVVLLGILADDAEAQQLQCDVHAIRASATGEAISPSLEPFRSHLLRPPLATFTSFELIETQRLTLSAGRPSPLTLQVNVSGEFELSSSANGQNMLRLSLQHESRNLVNTRFRATEGHPFFVVVGSVIPRGTLVLGFVCR